MRKKIDEAKYRILYGRRLQIIEPCFSDTSYCKGGSGFAEGRAKSGLVCDSTPDH
jgi:hypothetical protein